jgi:hypothetical protein
MLIYAGVASGDILANQPVEPLNRGISATKSAKNGIVVKNWSKDELKEKPVPPVDSAFDKIVQKISGFIVSVGEKDAPTSSESGLMKLYASNQEMTKTEYLYRLGTLRELPPRQQGNKAGLATYLRGQSGSVASERISANLPLLTSFKQGLNFDLNFSGTKSAEPSGQKVGQRYGLILQDIRIGVPDKPQDLTMRDSSDSELFVSQSKLIWTIGPITEENRRLFQYEPASFDSLQTQSVWSKINLPSPNMKIKVSPATTNIQDYVNVREPAYIVNVTQVEGLYQLSYLSRDKDAKSQTNHTIVVPIVGTLTLLRVFDVKGRPTRLEANKVLISEHAPIVNFQFIDAERLYTTESIYICGAHTFKLGTERRLGPTDATHPAIRYNTGYAMVF